jgi:myo-inositol-1(or 4)-monophosphatase
MDMPQVLLALHRRLREALSADPDYRADPAISDSGERNPKGDVCQTFDLVADALIHEELKALCPNATVYSEERVDETVFGSQPGRYRFVVDPVDGSDNFGRGLPLSALSIAVLAVEGAIAVDDVAHALVGGLDEEDPFQATRQKGAWRGTERLKTSRVRRIEDAFVSCELNHWAPDRRLAEILRRSRGIRTYGCASRAIALVASGALDAHIDVRDRLTPESFLAASLLLTEAGGYACRPDGSPLGPFSSIREKTGLIAAAGEDLALAIVAGLSA